MCKIYYICSKCKHLWKLTTNEKQCEFKLNDYVRREDKCIFSECVGTLKYDSLKECPYRTVYKYERLHKKGFHILPKNEEHSRLKIINYNLENYEMKELREYFVDKNQSFCILESLPSSTSELIFYKSKTEQVCKFLNEKGYELFTDTK